MYFMIVRTGPIDALFLGLNGEWTATEGLAKRYGTIERAQAALARLNDKTARIMQRMGLP